MERFDRVETRGLPRWKITEDHADCDGYAESEDCAVPWNGERPS